MIKSVIIDDESRNIKILKSLLEEFCPQVKVAGSAANGAEGVELIRKEKPDLVFLDIEMPQGNAFDMLDQLQPVNFEIIFITAFSNYSLKAIKYSALDYILKPVDIDELKTAIAKVIGRLEAKNPSMPQLEHFVNSMLKQQTTLEKLALPSQEGLIFVPVREITRCEANGGYTWFYRQNGTKIISPRNIKEYEEILPGDIFCRIHNSHIVNVNFVKKYHRGRGGIIEMEDGSLIELATRRKEDFLARFGIRS